MMIESETGGGDTNDSETNDTTKLLENYAQKKKGVYHWMKEWAICP